MSEQIHAVAAPIRSKCASLFQPIQLNRLVLANRALMSSIHLNLEGFPDQYARMGQFYAYRAKHKAGLIVTGGCSPDVAGAFAPDGLSLKSDEEIANHRQIVAPVKEAGGKIALQIIHFGREAVHGQLVSASGVKLESSMFTPRAMEEAEILELIDAYRKCALRAIEAGYDAIELIYSQGFLVHQFLSLVTNKRIDRWGGSIENRCRLAVEIARAVREAVGYDYPIIFRIPCMDLLEGGMSTPEVDYLIEQLMPFQIDLLSVSIGWHDSYVPTIAMVAPRAAFASATRYLRARFPDLKLCVSNRINDPRVADQLVMDGTADMVAMARPFLADGALMDKASRNDFAGINTCIACNQNCLDYVFSGEPVGCSVNPQAVTPEEGEFTPFTGQNISAAVIGAGLSGLASAYFLAKRGAQVDLFEEKGEVGGQLNLAVEVPDKKEFLETIRYYRNAALGAGVRLHLGRRFEASVEDAGRFDHVFVATGCVPRELEGIPGIELPHVRQYTDVLGDKLPVLLPAVIIGGGGVACDVAKYLAKRQDELRTQSHRYLTERADNAAVTAQLNADVKPDGAITLIQRSSRKFAMRLGRTTRWIQLAEMERLGIRLRNKLEIRCITDQYVEILDKRSGQVEQLPARTVIIAAGHMPSLTVADSLKERGINCTVVGSALTEGAKATTNISSAVKSAYTAVTSLA